MVFPVVMYGHELDHKEGCTKGTKLSRSVVAIPWTIAYQAPPSMEFSRQEYWSGLPFPSPGELPDPGVEPGSPTLQTDVSPSEPPGKPENHSGKEYF